MNTYYLPCHEKKLVLQALLSYKEGRFHSFNDFILFWCVKEIMCIDYCKEAFEQYKPGYFINDQIIYEDPASQIDGFAILNIILFVCGNTT